MSRRNSKKKARHLGAISTRFAGTDGVSLEMAKWADVLEQMGHTCFYFAGELDRPPERSMLVEEAHFAHHEIRDIYSHCFKTRARKPEVTKKIYEVKEHLKEKLYEFIETFDIDLLILQNALTIPLNVPLGIAITEVLAETGLPAIAHHHDFFWERKRFLVNAVWDYLNMAFPPHLPNIHHVVINSSAGNQLSLRTGVSSMLIPNVMDFDNPPPPRDEYSADVRESFGIEDDELLILQPTRVVKRKGIETSIELTRRLGRKAKLVISHAADDEGHGYQERVREYSALFDVDTLFVSGTIGERRGTTSDGKKIYTIWDVYPYADLVTYPSTFEGFGNAFLETLYFKRPIAVNIYSVYATDIKPKGFKVIELDDYITDSSIRLTRQILANPKMAEELVEHNYDLGKRYYSYRMLRKKLSILLSESFGADQPPPARWQ
ncbi:MAG: glycosyltransferase family 4 protein [Candidatus Abyssubacteria bacterium]|nr:glycosyltransferase family 4 protein [Candidatus Abyssubacteria bacterium]